VADRHYPVAGNRVRNILLTNDDGIGSPGLRLLYEAVSELGSIRIIAPLESRSACGHGMTLGRLIRARHVTLWGEIEALAIDGLPVDAVYIALSTVPRPGIVLAGINAGDNTSLQSIIASSTIGAVVHAALNGIPGIAFSLEARSPQPFSSISPGYRSLIRRFIRGLVDALASTTLVQRIGALSVNFPYKLAKNEAVVAYPARLRFLQRVEKVKEEKDTIYYKIVGQPLNYSDGSDVACLLSGRIVLTPLCISGLAACQNQYETELEEIASQVLDEAISDT